jgi:hypothetical protein
MRNGLNMIFLLKTKREIKIIISILMEDLNCEIFAGRA